MHFIFIIFYNKEIKCACKESNSEINKHKTSNIYRGEKKMQVRSEVGEIDYCTRNTILIVPTLHELWDDVCRTGWGPVSRLQMSIINGDPCGFPPPETLPLAKGMPVGVPTIPQHTHDTLCAERGMGRSIKNNTLVKQTKFHDESHKNELYPLWKSKRHFFVFINHFFAIQKWHEKISYITFAVDMKVPQWGRKVWL